MTFNRLEIGELVTLRQGFAINKKTNYHISEKARIYHYFVLEI